MKMTQGLTKRGKVYWLRHRIPGFGLVQMSLDTDSLGHALIKRDAILRNPAEHIHSFRDDLSDYAEDQRIRGLSTRWIADTQIVLSAITRHIGREAKHWTAQQIQEWQTTISNRRTAAAYLQRVRTFFRWMVRSNRIAKSPADLLPKVKTSPSIRRRFLSRKETDALFASAPDDEMRFILFCALHAGMRKGEIIASRPGWFDLAAGLIHIQNEVEWQIKDRTDRTVPLTGKFAEFLTAYGLRKPYMIAPEAKKGKHRYRFDFNRRFQAMKTEAGIDCTFHDLRRTFASLLVSKGVSIYKVAKWLGDGVGVVEKHYGHLSAQDTDIDAAWQ